MTEDEIRRAMYEAAAKGWLELVGECDGEPVFRLTPEGVRHVHELGVLPDRVVEGEW